GPLVHRTLAHDIRRCLVVAQAEILGVSKLAVRGPLTEPDLGDEMRPHPVRTGLADAIAERGGVLFEPVELLAQRHERLRVEAGTDLARVAQIATFVVAHEQRAEPDATALRLGEAADDELLLGFALELQPVGTASPDVS